MPQFIRLTIGIGLLLPVISFSSLAQDSKEEARQRFAESLNKPVAYRIAGMESVVVRKNLVYKRTDNPNLRMDVYIPPGVSKSERRPAVVFVHGGAGEKGDYQPKDWGFFKDYGRLIAASGMVAVIFTQSLGYPRTAIEDGAQDLRDLLEHIRTNAGSYSIDQNRIALISFSGGGPLLTVAMRGETPYLRCLVGMYTILDTRNISVITQSESQEVVKDYSALLAVQEHPARIPPILVVRAGKDQWPEILSSIDQFISVAVSSNVAVSVVNYPEGVHGFDYLQPGVQSGVVVKTVVEFLKSHLEQD